MVVASVPITVLARAAESEIIKSHLASASGIYVSFRGR